MRLLISSLERLINQSIIWNLAFNGRIYNWICERKSVMTWDIKQRQLDAFVGLSVGKEFRKKSGVGKIANNH